MKGRSSFVPFDLKSASICLQKNCTQKIPSLDIAGIPEAAQDKCCNPSWTNLLSERPKGSFCLKKK